MIDVFSDRTQAGRLLAREVLALKLVDPVVRQPLIDAEAEWVRQWHQRSGWPEVVSLRSGDDNGCRGWALQFP